VRNRSYTFAYVILLMVGTAGLGVAQDGGQQPSAREQLQDIHTPQSIDQKLASLTKDLELTPKQQRQVRPLLQEHHDKIQGQIVTIQRTRNSLASVPSLSFQAKGQAAKAPLILLLFAFAAGVVVGGRW
jgi:Spy/CpxP family protein refolding chaperone